MEKVLIDTDIIIDFLRDFNKRNKLIFKRVDNKTIDPYISVINLVELFSGKNIKNEKKIIENLLTYFKIIPVEADICNLAGTIKRNHNLYIADAIIAAICIKKNLCLATFNTKHFKNIKELKLYPLRT